MYLLKLDEGRWQLGDRYLGDGEVLKLWLSGDQETLPMVFDLTPIPAAELDLPRRVQVTLVINEPNPLMIVPEKIEAFVGVDYLGGRITYASLEEV